MKLGNPFPRANRRPRNRNGNKSTVSATEYNGASAGAHTIALGVTSIPSVKNALAYDSPWFLLGCAILRRIFKKHYGVNVENHGQFIDHLLPPPVRTQGTAVAEEPLISQIKFYRLHQNDSNVNALSEVFVLTMPKRTASDADRTFAKVAADLGSEIQKYFGYVYAESIGGNASTNLTARNMFSLYGYSIEELVSLTSAVVTDPTNRRWSMIHRIDNWIMSLKYTTKIRIQNVSPNMFETGGTYSSSTYSDTLEQNALVGKIYHSSEPYLRIAPRLLSVTHAVGGPTPLSQVDYNVFLKDVGGDGIVKPAGTDLVPLRHIPTVDAFANVSGYTPFMLRPGETKTYKQHFNFNGYINKLILGLSATYGYDASVPTNAVQYYGRSKFDRGFGTHDMFMFEDYNGAHHVTGGNPNIQISYQINRLQSCVFVKQTQTGMQLIRDYNTPVNAVADDAAF